MSVYVFDNCKKIHVNDIFGYKLCNGSCYNPIAIIAENQKLAFLTVTVNGPAVYNYIDDTYDFYYDDNGVTMKRVTKIGLKYGNARYNKSMFLTPIIMPLWTNYCVLFITTTISPIGFDLPQDTFIHFTDPCMSNLSITIKWSDIFYF